MNGDTFQLGPWVARLLSHWRRHVLRALVAGALMAGLTYLMTPWFRATSTLLPPEDADPSMGAISMQRFLSRVPSVTGISNLYSPSDLYVAILRSRSIQQAVLDSFDMRQIYRVKSDEKVLREFRRHLKVNMGPDGTIAVSVEDRSRQRAADLTNALIDELDRFNVHQRNTRGRRARQFLESRIGETDSLLRRAESEMREYQERHHIVAPPQVEAANLGPLADVMARKMALEVRLQVLRSYLRDDNEQVVQVRTELEQVKSQLQGLPRIETVLGRLARDVRLYQQVYALLTSQLEEARLRETMDTPTVTVLDPAIPPERKARPIRSLWVVGGMLAGLIAGVLWDERPAWIRRRPAPSPAA
jgi:uncharacterized protein involved in exopolysaccharide biosynthesis